MDDKKWKLLSSKPVFESKWMTIEDRSYELPDGTKAEGYLHLKRANYVLIFAIEDKQRIVVERQYRRGVDDFVYELPAGWVKENEKPVDAAKRELQEETGFVGEGELEAELYAQPAFSSIKAYVVVLHITGSGEHNRDNDETLEHELVEISKVKDMIQTGQIKDMGFLSAFSLFENLRK